MLVEEVPIHLLHLLVGVEVDAVDSRLRREGLAVLVGEQLCVERGGHWPEGGTAVAALAPGGLLDLLGGTHPARGVPVAGSEVPRRRLQVLAALGTLGHRLLRVQPRSRVG